MQFRSKTYEAMVEIGLGFVEYENILIGPGSRGEQTQRGKHMDDLRRDNLSYRRIIQQLRSRRETQEGESEGI